jgi:uncharacterized glyoxalase superfamily protein PhnB
VNPFVIDVAVSDVEAAVRFYRVSFEPESVLETGSGAVELWMHAEEGPVLRVIDERESTPSMRDRDMYDKGRTPRMELVVDDVDEWVDRMAAAGATVRRRLVPGKDRVLRKRAEGDGPTRYAAVLDPFGHLWAIASDDE